MRKMKRQALLNLLTMVVKSRALINLQAIQWQLMRTGTQQNYYSLERKENIIRLSN